MSTFRGSTVTECHAPNTDVRAAIEQVVHTVSVMFKAALIKHVQKGGLSVCSAHMTVMTLPNAISIQIFEGQNFHEKAFFIINFFHDFEYRTHSYSMAETHENFSPQKLELYVT